MWRASRVKADELDCYVKGDPGPGGTVVFIHGLGDTGEGWLMELHRSLPGVRIVAPNAPTAPVTVNGGMAMPSWFDLVTLDETLLNAENDSCAGLVESVARVSKIVDREVKLAGNDASKVVLGGFSQGGALAAHAGYGFPASLGGIVIVSGWPAGWELWKLAKCQEKTPALLVHGKADQVVLPRFGSELRDRLVKQNLAAKLVTHDGGHGLGPRMDDVRDFILGALKKGGNNQ